MDSPVKKTNPISWLIRYFKESHEELRKVSWPNRKTASRYSIIVIVLCVVIALFFGGMDWLLNKGMEWLIALTS
jgi:preprotein translocase subunit SecE